MEPWLEAGLPAGLAVHRVAGLGLGWSRVPGLGTLLLRAYAALRRGGDRLLTRYRFDLVYFSTTQFGVQMLGARWLRKFGVPFALDYQDPWVNDYYKRHPDVVPPGGRIKYAFVARLSRWMEPRVLRCCAGITSVSPEYPCQLRRRYSFLSPDWPVEVLPFPAEESELERVAANGVKQESFSPKNGELHWVYIGRGGEDMHRAVRALFGALREHERNEPGFLKRLHLHFIGTSYAPAGKGRKTIEPLAADYGLGSVVREYPDRIPYSQALRCLLDADALLVPGSDDPSYTASKIYPYLLARKPLLAIFHQRSSVASLLSTVGGGVCTPFTNGECPELFASRIRARWLQNQQWKQTIPLNRQAFEPYTARASCVRLTAFFEKCLTFHRTELRRQEANDNQATN